jgi:NAD(P)H-quinone oxidoreductase subunit 5
MASGIVALYFALQRGSEWLLAGALPATRPLNGPLDLAIVAGVIASFAGVTLLQSELGRARVSPFFQALYVHLANGLYVNTLANRWAVRFWPARASSIPSSR